MHEVKLSIIIPHYNSADLLKKLLATIPDQKEIQVLVVDDFSTGKKEEYEECKLQYPYAEFYTNECGKSAGGARNTGLKYAKGKWLLFADSDDYYLPDFYDKVSAFFDSTYDIVYFTPTSIELPGGQVSDRHIATEKFIRNYIASPTLKNKLELKYSFVAPWSKLIRKELFDRNNIKFDEVMVANDVMASVKLAYFTEKIAATSERIYCITKHADSLETTITYERFDARLEIYYEKYRFLKEHLSREEYGLVNFKAKSRLYEIAQNRMGKWYYIKTYCRIILHGIPIWREYKWYRNLFYRGMK